MSVNTVKVAPHATMLSKQETKKNLQIKVKTSIGTTTDIEIERRDRGDRKNKKGEKEIRKQRKRL